MHNQMHLGRRCGTTFPMASVNIVWISLIAIHFLPKKLTRARRTSRGCTIVIFFFDCESSRLSMTCTSPILLLRLVPTGQ